MEKVTPLAVITELNSALGTHEGMVGKNNEDSLGFYAWQAAEQVLYMGIVADGVGGQTAGETASQMAVELISDHFATLPALNEIDLLKHMDLAVREANHQVYERALHDDELQGMATTVVVAAVMNNRLYTSHVGDSRIYLLRAGEFHQLTVDHSWVQEAVTAGLLTAEQAKHHPNKNVIRRSLGGMTDVEVDQRPRPTPALKAHQGLALMPQDIVLLCSDGLTDMIDDDMVQESLETHRGDLDAAVDELIDKANAAGGRDNISVVLMQIPGNGAAPVKPEPAQPEPAKAAVSASKPRVVPVALNKTAQEIQARKRRLLLIAIAVLTMAVLALILILQFGGPPGS